MFQENFTKLDVEESAVILDELNPLLEGTPFDPLKTTILAHPATFYPGYRILEISDHSMAPPLQRFALYKPGDPVVLNFSNEPIYALNRRLPLKLDDSNVLDYTRFFFNYVRGRHGRFIITEGVDDIKWKEEPPPAARKAVGKLLTPLEIKNKMEHGVYNLTACVMFRDALFRTNIHIIPNGDVALSDEELLIEDMPVQDDTFGQ